MIKESLDWLRSNKCKYCGCELAIKTGTERIICRVCGKINYKNKKIAFQNEMKKKLLEEKRKLK